MELDIAGLDTAGRDELLEHWRCLIGRPPPKHISRSLLIQILAFELQSKQHGGFSKRLSQRLTRAGHVDEMVGAALFLSTQASSFMTGEVLTLSGGY